MSASAYYGFNGFFNGNAAVNYNHGPWGVRMNYAATYEKDKIESELHRVIRQTGNGIDQQIDATRKNTNHNIGLNLNYKATTKDILTLDAKLGVPRMNNFQNFHNHYLTAGVEDEKFRQTDITFDRTMLEGSLTYKHLFTPGKKELSMVASASSIKGNRPSYYYEEGTMVQRSVSGGHPLNVAFQLDYTTMLGKTKLEVGGKMTYRQNNIDHKMYERPTEADEWSLSVPLSNDLEHREYIPALYGMVSGKFTQRLTYKAGVRMEYSRVTLHSDKEQLDDESDTWFLAPNLVLNYKVSEPFALTFGLSRRISHPTYPQLNPYINLIDNQTYEMGNVHLKPEKVNKVDVGYSYSSNVLTLNGNAYFNYTQDYINQIAYLAPEAIVMSYINGKMDVKTGLEQNVTVKPLRWMDFEISTNIYYTRSRGDFDGLTISNSGWVSNSNLALRLRPMRGMSLQSQYYVTTPQYFPQFTTKTIHYCDLGIKQTLLKGQLTLSALLTDVFNTRRWDIHSDNTLYTLTNLSKNRSRVFWLGATWNFNSFKPMSGSKKKEDDRSVIRLGE